MFLKNICLIFICMIAHVTVSEGVIQRVYEPPSLHPDHPGKCWSAAKNRAYNVDDSFTDSERCDLLKCDRNLKFLRTSCDLRPPQDGCFRTEPDRSKNYPHCCPKVRCPPVKIDY